MKTTDIIRLRLYNQQLTAPRIKTIKAMVGLLGAMQSQEYAASKWAIGIRVPGSTQAAIDKALDKGEILRTHVLRPTWHYVTAEDIHWMLALSAPQQRAAVKYRQKFLELTPAILNKSNRIIEKALSNGDHLTRKELLALLQQNKINTKAERSSHILFQAEIDSIICSGRPRGKEIAYALLSERVRSGKIFPREEALAKLAHRFFTGHGPATVQDFTWWSGLSVTESKSALEAVKKDFESFIVDENTYWHAPDKSAPSKITSAALLLPPFDEYIIGYADRSAVLLDPSNKRNLFVNGLFKATIAVNGKAIGTWKRVIKKQKSTVELQYFKKPAQTTAAQIKKAIKEYLRFTAED